MSRLVESVAEPLSRLPIGDEQAYTSLLADAAHLRSVMDTFLQPSATAGALADQTIPPAPATTLESAPPTYRVLPSTETSPEDDFLRVLTLTVGQCRSQRTSVSLVLLGAAGASTRQPGGQQAISQLLDAACLVEGITGMTVESRGACQRVFLLPAFDRQQAVHFAQQRIESLQTMPSRLEAGGKSLQCEMGAGVASVTLPPKNFPPLDLLETAERCLQAAQPASSFSVKSLEIY